MKLHRRIKTMLRTRLSRGEGLGIFHPVVGKRERQLFPNPIAINFKLVRRTPAGVEATYHRPG